MNRLTQKKRIQILNLLLEGAGIRSSARNADVSPHTVLSLLRAAGRAGAIFHDQHVKGVEAKRVQADETWSFIYAKQRHLEHAKSPPPEAGDIWTWVAIDIDTKLVISYLVGGRGLEFARTFMRDLASRLEGRVELTTDAYGAYPQAIEEAFSGRVDYGTTEMEGVSNSFVERQNLTMRSHMKRYARETNAHSKTLRYHVAAVNLYFLWYNWCRIHSTIRCTPAMEAGLTKELHDMEWLAELIDDYSS